MQTIQTAMTALLGVEWLITAWSIWSRYGSPLPQEKTCVRNPAFMLWIGVIFMALFSVPSVICLVNGDTGTGVFFPLFMLMGTALALAGGRWRICYDRDGFEVRTIFGRTHVCRWDDVTGWSGGSDVWVKTVHGTFLVDSLAINGEPFLRSMKSRCTHVRGSTPSRVDALFRGNVRSPEEFLVLFVLLGGLCAFMLGMGAWEMTPKTPEGSLCETIAFDRYEEKERHLRLYAGEKEYRVGTGHDDVAKTMLHLCGTGAEITVYSGDPLPVQSGSFRRVFALTGPDGTEYLTFGQYNRNGMQAGAFLLGMSALLAGMMLMMMLVGRYPERFSPAVRGMFFKPGYLRVPPGKKR